MGYPPSPHIVPTQPFNPSTPVAEVPCSSARRLQLGCLEECGQVRSGTTDLEGGQKVPSWLKNCSRQAWGTFAKYNIGWKIKLSSYDFDPGDGNIISFPYLSPTSILQYFMENHPDIVVGGITCPVERAHHLEAFWAGFRLNEPSHKVFEEHQHNLQNVIPLYYHGDEGRGKRRGNTVVVSMETPIGIHTLAESKKRKTACGCQPPLHLQRKYRRTNDDVPARHKSRLLSQRTNMKGHSFLQHWCLFVIPSVYHHAYPQLLMEMMQVVSDEFRSLFYDGITVHGKNFCAAVCGHKGDLKWFTKVAKLTRSYEHKGQVRNLLCCHECMAGTGDKPWEDFRETPAWASTRYSVRPWDPNRPPPLVSIPHSTTAPERQLKRDPFHLCKTGIFRDHVGSCICWMTHANLFGAAGDYDQKLRSAHGSFQLFCQTEQKTPALRSFSRAFLQYKSFDVFPWMNCKGSDSMLCLQWIIVLCVGFANDPNNGADREILRLMKSTSEAAVAIFKFLNSHGLFYEKPCGMTFYAEVTRFINGYNLLANAVLNSFKLWGLKPKIHLLKHTCYDCQELLEQGCSTFLNANATNAEQNEDFIGKVCRLSRRFHSRHVSRRVLHALLLKGHLLHRRFKLHSR